MQERRQLDEVRVGVTAGVLDQISNKRNAGKLLFVVGEEAGFPVINKDILDAARLLERYSCGASFGHQASRVFRQ